MIPPQLKPSPLSIDTAELQSSFQLFGLSIATNHSFENSFPPAGPPIDLLFITLSQAPVPVDLTNEEPRYASQGQTSDGESLFTFYTTGNCIILRFAAFADFYLWSDMIVCHVLYPEYEFMVEISFLGTVMACWFELQGILALHAAASVIDGRAVAFLSSNKGGKSSLAATLMQQGYPLLTDDVLLIEQQNGRILGRSSYPQMRLWPEQAAQLFGRDQHFPKVQPYLDKRRIPIDFEKPGMFETGRFPLTRCYIPERYTPEKDKKDVTITPVPAIQSVLTLAGYSFLYWLVEAIGLQPGRLKTLARVAQTVTVSQLKYPESIEHLPAVCQAILFDL